MSKEIVEDVIHFVGFLSNVDESISKISLQHGLTIQVMSTLDAIKFLAQIRGTDGSNSHRELSEYSCVSLEGRVYSVRKTITGKVLKNQQFTGTPPHLAKFDDDIVNKYLRPAFQKMRLFKHGNIQMPAIYYYRDYEGKPRSFRSQRTLLHVSRERFSISDNDEINNFIRKIKIPFSKQYLQLALENYDLSYQVMPLNLEFLLLMISLEAMFNPGKEEIRYRITRSLAVLLGQNKSESETIFKDARDLYDKRSDLVHNGKNKISNTDVTKLREFVRESIKILANVDKDKDFILLELNSAAFGSHPFTT